MSGTTLLRTFSQKVRVLGVRGLLRRAWWILSRDGWAGLTARIRHWRTAGTQPYRGGAFIPEVAIAGAGSGGVNLVGHPYGALGMGEHIRKSAQAFAAASVPFGIFNTFDQLGAYSDKFEEFPFHHVIGREVPHGVSIFHMNADEMKLAVAHLPPTFFEGRYNIGYWAWELARFPDAWSYAFQYFDEIWAPSRFIQQAVAEKAPCPVIHMPLAVDFSSEAPLPRRHFRLPERKFLFLFYFDFTSYVGRKNPLGALRAFRAAFPRQGRSDVALVIKLNGMEQRPAEYERFLREVGEPDESIVLIDRVMSDREVRNLVRNCDSFVSLHRSEGFGRGLAEGMFYGKPVIGTAYSGNLDFMNPDNACLVDAVLAPVGAGEYPYGDGQFWAEPDVEHAAYHMRRLVTDVALSRQLGARAAQYMRAHHSFAAVGAKYRARLARLGYMAAP
ncbi:MAG: glycosyltransferase family 4 protein [Casimicrobiaceae bacterium]